MANGNGSELTEKTKVSLGLILVLAGIVGAGIGAWATTIARVAVVEAKQEITDKRTERIEQKIDDILRELRKP